jgi:hypothetical protein
LNGKYLIAADAADRQTLMYHYVFGKDAWLDLLPDGRFDASPEGMKYLSYTETEEDNQGTLQFKSYNTEELKEEFHQPQAVKGVVDEYHKANH